MIRSQRLAAVLSALAMSAVLAGCAADDTSAPDDAPGVVNQAARALLPEDVLASNVLKVGTPFGVPPSIYFDEDGELIGAGYEIVNAVGDALGVQMEWHEAQFSGIVTGVQSGNFDLSAGVISDTPARQEQLDFVDWLRSENALLVLKDNPAGITGLASACGHSVGVLAGGQQLALVEAASAECTAAGEASIDIREYPGTSDAQVQVQSGRLDAFVGPSVSFLYMINETDGGELFSIADERYPENPAGFAYAKNRPGLGEAIQLALRGIVEDGTYLEILNRYGVGELALSPEQVLINGAGTDAFAQ